LAVVSRLAPNKRIDHAVRVVKCLADKNIHATLTIVGTGENEKQLRQLAADLQIGDQVFFVGPLSEEQKNEQLRRAHFLLHTSLREGWGLNIIEANAMGTPAVVYPVAGLVESTLHDETGVVTRAETPESMADALLDIVKAPDKYNRFRVNAWTRSKTFHWNQVLPPACDWLESLVTKPLSK
jgi:glycosyltransferase involved in cell wall biosynthesis